MQLLLVEYKKGTELLLKLKSIDNCVVLDICVKPSLLVLSL